jgi:hypothetical protein
MRRETIKKKTHQGLTALGAMLALVIALTVRGAEDVHTLVVCLALLGLYGLPIIIGVGLKRPVRDIMKQLEPALKPFTKGVLKGLENFVQRRAGATD